MFLGIFLNYFFKKKDGIYIIKSFFKNVRFLQYGRLYNKNKEIIFFRVKIRYFIAMHNCYKNMINIYFYKNNSIKKNVFLLVSISKTLGSK